MDASTPIPEPPRDRGRRLLNGFVGGFFLVAIFAPTVDMLVRDGDESSAQAEFRAATERPALPRSIPELEAWPEKYTAYYRDSFGLRDKLIRGHNYLKWFTLGESPTDRIVVGEDGWVFYTEGRSIETYRGVDPLGEVELEAWQRMLEGRRNWLAAQGIEFLYVVVPNKSSLYADKMPKQLDRLGPSRREQFFDYMAQHSDVHVLDLLPALEAERAFDTGEDFTYNHYGTHWTDRGALAGYRAIVAELGRTWPDMVAWPRTDFFSRPGEDLYGDSWAGRLYLADKLDETFLSYGTKRRRSSQLDRSIPMPPRANHFSQPAPELPSGLMLHDSFGPLLNPLLAQHFADFWTFWQADFPTDVITKARPDVVIQVYVERSLVAEAPSLSQDVGRDWLREHFAASKQTQMVLAPADMPAGLRAVGDTELTPIPGEPAGMQIFTLSGTDLVELPAGDFPENTSSILFLDITSRRDTTLTVFVPKASGSDDARGGAYSLRLKKGRNRVFLDLALSGIRTSLRVRPGLVPDRYLLHHAELRAVPSRATTTND